MRKNHDTNKHKLRMASLFMRLSVGCFGVPAMLSLAFGARMALVIHAGEVLVIEVGVYLRRAQLAVAEQFLDGADVAGRLQQVAGEAVAQHVRGDAPSGQAALRVVAEALLHAAHAEARAAVVDE